MRDLLLNMLSVIFRSDYLDGSSEFLLLNSERVKDLFQFIFGNNLDGASGIYSIIKPLSLWLLIIFALISIIEKLDFESFSFNTIAKIGVGLVISLAVILFLPSVLLGLLTVTNSLSITLFKQVGSIGLGSGDMITQAQLSTLVDSVFTSGNFFNNLMSQLGGVISLFIPWLVSWATIIIMKCVMISRILEICIKGCMAPLAVVDIGRGHGSNGMRYIKGFFALGLQSCLIIIISHLTSFFSGSMLNLSNPSLGNIVGCAFGNLVIPICGIMLMLKVNQISKDIVGA